MYYVNPNIQDTVRIFPPQNRRGYLRLDMNENPEGLPKQFVDEVVSELTPQYIASYPEPDVFKEKYAGFINVEPENVCLTNGSDAAIRYTFEVFAKKGSSVVTVSPSFEMYAVNCSMLGLVNKSISFDESFNISIDEIIAAIDDTTDIVVLLNPNNPIGDNYTTEDAERIIKKANEVGAIVIFDEAYHYFCKSTFIDLINKYDNVVIFRTFSKMFSMAGLRLGMVISNPNIITYLNKAKPSFEVNTVSLKFGEKLLDNPEVIDTLINTSIDGRNYLLKALDDNNYEYYPQSGNFIFIKPHIDTKLLEEKLKEKKILIKTYGNPLLKDYIRINTGSPKIMAQFIEELIDADR